MKLLKWKEAQQEIKTGTTFLEFTTTWCGDCKMMEPVVANAENELKDKDIKFISVDAEEAKLFKDSASEIEVLHVPSFFKVVDGKYTHIGYEYQPLEKLTTPFK